MLLNIDSSLDTVTAERKKYTDEIARIEKLRSRSDRWRAIQKLMFHINPDLREEDLIHQETVKQKRMEQLLSTGATKSGSMRSLYSMPEYLYRALQTIDPEFQALQSSGDTLTVKKFNKIIWELFPEYRIAEKY
jgi:hypothetical protein